LNFSRPSGQIIAQFFAAELAKLGPFEIIHGGDPAIG
jgi:hypothetical protein